MSARPDDSAVDDVDVEKAWKSLTATPRSQLVDVRTRAEWTYVGIPDLGSIGKRPLLVEWQTFPDQSVDPRFVERLAGELKALGIQADDELFFICRSGSRSLAAAKAMAEAGYRACHNVAGGFEGPLNEGRHRGAVEGWKAAGLPWQQS
ncbi:MAG TPA: rhodanese-like domain-containing protein [Methyloceanibacter sp.]|nr:rhodanese-like domain-containing protein [Methyloceanibacter sp.]